MLLLSVLNTGEAGAQVRLGVLGDSLSDGIGCCGQFPNWHTQLAGTGQFDVTDNVAQSGATSFDVLNGQIGLMESAISGGSVDLVGLMIGGNDPAPYLNDLVFGNTSGFVNAVSANINETLSRLDAAGTVPVIWANIPDITITPLVQSQIPDGFLSGARDAISQVNQISQDFALSRGIPVVDLYSMSQDILTSPFQIAGVTESDFFSNDSFHPDPLAHGLISNTFIELRSIRV